MADISEISTTKLTLYDRIVQSTPVKNIGKPRVLRTLEQIFGIRDEHRKSLKDMFTLMIMRREYEICQYKKYGYL